MRTKQSTYKHDEVEMEHDYTHILYVMPSSCSGSKLAFAIAREIPQIYIDDATTIPPDQRPRFLIGTPTLLDLQQRKVLYGSQAIHALTLLQELTVAEDTAAAPAEVTEDPRYDDDYKISMSDVERLRQQRSHAS